MTRPVEGSSSPELTPRQTRLVLVVMAVSLMTVVSAVSGLNIALPSLARETGASQSELTWIVDAYTVVFAGLLLFAGALGDRFGRKLLLEIGLVLFGIAAGLGMIVNDPGLLIAVRALMGVGAAAIMPTTLSVITTSFPEAERPRAIGVWVGMAGGGAVLGLFGAGLLLEFFPWQSFFALNIVLATLGFIGVVTLVPASADEDPPPLDFVGAVLSLVTVSALVFGIIEGPEQGWDDPATVAGIVAGLIAGVAFVVWELRTKAPMLDPRLFRSRALSAGTLTIMLQFFAAFGFFFTAIQYLQFVTNRSPLEAAAALLPLPFFLLPVARNAPVVAGRVGFRRLAPLGLVLMAAGMLVMSRLDLTTPYWVFAGGLALFAIGMGLAGTPATTAITAALPVSKQGVASAVNDTARELGSALGIAILGSVLNQGYRDGLADVVTRLPPDVAAGVLRSIAFTSSPLVAQFGEAGKQLVTTARTAFVGGVGDAMFVAAGVLTVAAIAVAILAPARLPDPDEVTRAAA